ncbi:MAG TPA: shikimate kinase [Symbiobacteriaceae bacterium]|nr:shikimate kinase [Symbiobacteriaceae bacterium]
MNAVLIGMMGSGKSTVGRLLAGALLRPFIDTDTLVELKAGALIRQIFAAEGEAGFRRREAEAVLEAVAEDGRIIATGGGAVLNPTSREALRRGALVFWLDAEPEELYRRAMHQGAAARPLLNGPDPLDTLRRLRDERAPAYAQAGHYCISAAGREPEAIADEIKLLLLSHEGDNAACHK